MAESPNAVAFGRLAALPRFAFQAMRWAGQIGANRRDTDEVRLQKAILCNALVFGGIPLQSLLAVFAWRYGETAMFAVVTTAVGLTVAGLIYLGYSRAHFSFFKFSQLAIPLLSPFLSLLLTGGLTNVAFSLIWGMVSPLLALVLYPPRQAALWLLAFLTLVLAGFAIQPYLRTSTSLPSTAIWMVGYGNLFAFSIMIFAALAILLHQRNEAHRLLKLEQQKAMGLLRNILPQEIVAILQERSGVIADKFEHASVLFADIVDFTPLSAGMSAESLVNLLNEVFSYFDLLTEKYQLEKIKTIGDCYMVAAGVPKPRPDHAQALTRLALELLDYTRQTRFAGHQLKFRIGIHSGPVVAGVIGRRKFIYDLWGDTVNTASRMESHGQHNMVQVTRETYELLQHEFHCLPLGCIKVKGKGLMEVWSVKCLRNATSPAVPLAEKEDAADDDWSLSSRR